MRIAAFFMTIGLMDCTWAAPPPKSAPLKTSSPPNGASIYRSHCASCHGLDGKGDGPVADSLRMRPNDLTSLKQRNSGVFPTARVNRMLDGDDALPVHGSKRMPVWGPGLGAERARALLQHLESMQK
jgi:mono/diheme cytochrome c family protein